VYGCVEMSDLSDSTKTGQGRNFPHLVFTVLREGLAAFDKLMGRIQPTASSEIDLSSAW
jgi:hypothetical protein